MKTQKFSVLAIGGIFLVLVLAGCSKREPLPSNPLIVSTGCVDCHTDQALLKKVATPEEAPSGQAGEG